MSFNLHHAGTTRMLFKSNKVIGLDIGTSSIKLVELETSGKKATLVTFGLVPTPVNAVAGGEIVDPIAVSQAIKELLDKTKTKRKNVSVGIWGTAVIIKRVSLPKMDVNLLDEQIRWEAEQYIPFDISEINLEYHILGSSKDSIDTMDILLVAAKKDLIFNYLESIESVGLTCSILDVSSFALANAFMHNYPTDTTQTTALFDIGSGVTNFVVIENNEVVFARDIPAGGLNYTNDIQRAMNITIDEAEILKLDYSFNRPTPEELKNIIQLSHESFCEELNRGIEFFTQTSSQSKIQKIFLTGGGSQVLGLKEYLGQVTQLPVEIFNPFNNVQIENKSAGPDYLHQISSLCGTGIGLGLRKVGDR